MGVIYGLDLSLNKAGLISVNEEGVLLNDTKIDVPASVQKQPMFRRKEYMRGRLRECIIDRADVLIVMEGYANYAKTNNILDVAELTGTFKADRIKEQAQGRLVVVSPMTLKKYILGVGKGGKELVLKGVYKKWGYDTDDNDQADAYGLAMFGVEYNQASLGVLPKDKAALECIRTVQKSMQKAEEVRR